MTRINTYYDTCPICGAGVVDDAPWFGNKHGRTRPYTCGHGHLVEVVQKNGTYSPRYGEDILEQLGSQENERTQMLTIKEVATIFRVTTRTIRNWVKADKLHPATLSEHGPHKLLFHINEVNSLLQPTGPKAKAADDLNGLVGTLVVFTSGETDTIEQVGTTSTGCVRILTRANGWFHMTGTSLREGSTLTIRDYYVEPGQALYHALTEEK